ncbi:esterase/lipase family protein [Luteolibacter sp. AS25]|uniref:esterase/lipase family protein n=1 Tax=Luteolibacter sp. AS25 TaxID=3135776 RepID=UPI00398AE75C
MITARFFHLFTGVFATAVSCQTQPQTPKFERAVLVHGIFEDGTAFDSLKRRLETHGIQCFVPQLKPADGRGGLDKLAENLKADINREFGENEKFALVSFSMGGLVSRHYLQNLGGAERCEMFITISSPHKGTKMAYSYFGKGAAQMRPGSLFLRQLKETEGNLGDIPAISYRTPMDLMILPPASSVWDRAENHSFNIVLHPLMLHSNSVLDDIERRFVLGEGEIGE